MTRHAPLCLEKPDVIVVGESLMEIVVQTEGSIRFISRPGSKVCGGGGPSYGPR
ncbi:hypothetical protein ABH915_000296 [Arthrobacter sp. MW3 TE3886]